MAVSEPPYQTHKRHIYCKHFKRPKKIPQPTSCEGQNTVS